MLARTASGNPPPTAFLITIWALAIVFLAFAAFCAVQGWRGYARSKQGPTPSGPMAQSSCLLAAGVPATLLGLFLLSWAIGISS